MEFELELQNQNEGNKFIKSVAFNMIFVLLCIILAYSISNYLFASTTVKQSSMVPSFVSGDRILIYKKSDIRHGDVVVFLESDSGKEDPDYLIKRIIGLPGDRIKIEYDLNEGRYVVFKNDVKLVEPYINPYNLTKKAFEEITVKEGEFFYLGDNRLKSEDSDEGHRGELKNIVGRVILKYEGFNFQIVERVTY